MSVKAQLEMILIQLGISGLILRNRMEKTKEEVGKSIKFLEAYIWNWHSVSTNVPLIRAGHITKSSET